MHLSRRELISAYLTRERNVQEDPNPALPGQTSGRLAAGEKLVVQQVVLVEAIIEKVRTALQRRYPEDDDAEQWIEYLQSMESANTRALAILGPAGSGKTTAVEIAIDKAVEMGAHVGIACPTAMLASRYRQHFPHLDVDTMHGMFLLHRSEILTLDVMMSYDMVVVDEVGQLTRWDFERIMRLWTAVDRRPALVFVGISINCAASILLERVTVLFGDKTSL